MAEKIRGQWDYDPNTDNQRYRYIFDLGLKLDKLPNPGEAIKLTIGDETFILNECSKDEISNDTFINSIYDRASGDINETGRLFGAHFEQIPN